MMTVRSGDNYYYPTRSMFGGECIFDDIPESTVVIIPKELGTAYLWLSNEGYTIQYFE